MYSQQCGYEKGGRQNNTKILLYVLDTDNIWYSTALGKFMIFLFQEDGWCFK